MKVELVHTGGWNDGYSTTLRINGKEFPEVHKHFEKVIDVIAEADCPLQIKVLMSNDEILVLEPDEFQLTMNDFFLAIDKDRRPCKIVLGGYEPKVKTCSIRFAEGELPLIHLAIIA